MKAPQLQKSFEASNDFLERIFNNTYNGIALVSLSGHWLKVNDSVCHLFGYSRSELFNLDIDNIVFIEDLGVHEEKYEKLILGEIDKYKVKQRYFHKDGSLIWVLIYVSLVYFKAGRPHMIWQFNDITKQEKNKEKLRAMLSVAKEQNERLTSFARIVTHNLRSHSGNLSAISGFLEDELEDIKGNENFKLLKNAIHSLEETVAHLTEVARIKKTDETEMESLNLYNYVQTAMYSIIAMAQNAGAIIYNEIDEALEVKAVPAYLESIILNFLTNAIKYRSLERTPIVELSSYILDNYAVLTIKDNGLGIDMEKFGNKIFQMYRTFHNNEDSIGIGLFITKNHIESMGGKVEVKSKVGEGTEFFIYFQKA
ncbi:sensor histidine kinase [Winogradskyella alexanderae]|uniref:histidine kinase n=1 Tax=Winogradskyella alexanderae TaxID=2877123 RepID=A0ABS7XTU3_9FLAO|nr:HAMP domain-containing sensor histidine kinase [Winogradskyella alexanderae]MCA0132426.1 PAS domain S-box protein [Winogradskyella alexanderae]